MNAAVNPKAQFISDIKNLRLSVDKFLNSIIFLKPSREVSLVRTSLQNSFAWLGICLKEIGEENPYPSSTDSKSAIIEPQADHADENIFDEDENRGSLRLERLKNFVLKLKTQFRYRELFSKKAGA